MHRRVALIVNTQGSRCGLCRKPVYHDVSTRCPSCYAEFGVLQVSHMSYATKFPRLRWKLPVEIHGRPQPVAGAAGRARRTSPPVPGSLIHGLRRAGQNAAAASLTLRKTVAATGSDSTPVLARPASSAPAATPLVPDSSI